MEGGIGEIAVPEDHGSSLDEAVLKEVTVVKDPDLTGNSSLGIVVDRPRNRLLVAISDVLGNNYNALAAYDLSTWDRLFLTKLGGSGTLLSLFFCSFGSFPFVFFWLITVPVRVEFDTIFY